MFGEPGAEIMYPDPGFPIYRSLIEWTGAEPVPIALHEEKGFAFSAEEVLARITPRTRLIIVNSPANPTGGVVPQGGDRRAGRAASSASPHVAVLSDEIYARMCYDGVPHASLLTYPELRDRLILLDGWSKTYAMTGWRLGWGVWPKSLVRSPTRLAINIHSCVNAATQWAGIAALRGPQDTRRPHGGGVRPAPRRDRGRAERIPGFRCVPPGGAFYAFPNVEGTGQEARASCRTSCSNKAGVAVISGTSFGIYGEGYLRFSYAASTEAILEACERIRRYLG